MAETEQLVVALEARIADFERNMKKASKSANDNWSSIENRGNRAARNLENQFSRAGSNIQRSLQSLGSIMPAALSGLATGAAIAEVGKLAEAWTNAKNKIVAAGVDINRGDATAGIVADIAQRSRADFGSVADLYARLTRVGGELKLSQADIAVATEAVTKALALTGATAAETSSTLIQLGQALGSGVLQGDELRSILENAPMVAKAIAQEFGVAVSQLKQMGSDGQLTSDRVFGALKRAAPEIEKAFAQSTATVSQSFKALESAAIRYVGTSATVKLATTTTGTAINAVAQNFDKVATGAAALGAVLAARLVAAGLTPAATALLATARAAAASAPALNAMNLALGASVARANAGALAMRGLSGALALVGGPAGAAILGIGAAAIYFGTKAQEASERSKQYAAALERLREASDAATGAQNGLGNAIGAATARTFEAQRAAINAQLKGTISDTENFASEIDGTLQRAANSMRSKFNANAGAAIDELREKFKSGELSAEQLSEALYKLANSNPSFGGLAERLGPLLSKLAGAIALAVELRKQLSGIAGEQSKSADQEIAARIPNPTAGTSYKADSEIANNDPVIRTLVGQGIQRRAVAEAEMDKTAKAIKDQKEKLTKEVLDAGGIIDVKNIDAQAKAIVAAQEAGKSKGGGKEAKAPKTDFDREETNVTRRIRAMQAEDEALKLSGFEAAKAEEKFRLLDSAKAAGMTIDDALIAKVDQLSSAYARAKIALDEAKQAHEQLKAQQQFLGDSISTALTDLLLEGKSLSEVFSNLAKAIAKAALQAALMGQGPLAGLFGTSPAVGGNGIGGLFGALFKGFSGGFADGGVISGPGGPRSDSILAAVSAGEFVVNADAASKFGPLLQAINSGKLPHFVNGGSVGAIPIPAMATSRGVGGAQTTIAPQINVKVEGGSRGEAADHKLGENIAKQVESQMRALIVQELRVQSRPGNMLSR